MSNTGHTHRLHAVPVAFVCACLAGCAEVPSSSPTASPVRPAQLSVAQLLRQPGGTYTDDAPDGAPPVDLERVADAMPKVEPLHPSANEPYMVFGRDYVPMAALTPYRRQGTASWYGRKFHGQRTTSGEVYDMYAMSAAHPTLPIPSFARVTNLQNRKSVIVRVNDRGPFASGRIMDVSYAAAHRLGFAGTGSAQVEVESVLPQETASPAAAPGSGAAAKAAPKAHGGRVDAIPSATATDPRPATDRVAPAQPEPALHARLEPAAAAAESPPVPMVSAEHNGIFLQLGAFSVRANAESFRVRMASRIGAIGARLLLDHRQDFFRVQLGPFRDRREAIAAAKQVRELVDLRPIVVVR
ncbi:MAG: septal ring lytic transglycosylase RlpA family protein [Betaproteobacteria bacterium]|nr:septal ring lytic transglycosylase RlpA family protein [Betaproteobacteria bacterium]